MKRLIPLILALIFVFSISACGNKKTSTKTETSMPTQSESFIKPQKYASVLLISMQSQFKLYLDENNRVLALESINDDAKSFSDNIDSQDQSVETVIGNIIEEANKNGTFKENVTVDFEITEHRDDMSTSDILTKAVRIVKQKASELNIELNAQIKEKDKSEDTATKTETSSPKDTTTTPTHTHSFSAATCTEPQKCSCGVTNGSPIGHKWQDATCKTPRTCSACQTTKGNIGDHKYVNGKCKYCNKKEIINPKIGLKERANYYYTYKGNDGYDYLMTFQFHNSTVDINGFYSTEEIWKEYSDGINYKRKKFYEVGGAGGPEPKQYTLTNTEVILKYVGVEDEPDLANSEYRFIVNSEYNLELVYSSGYSFFIEGAVLELVE